MTDPADTVADSPVDFDAAVAYALHPEMRRLVILYLVGVLLTPVGLSMFAGTRLLLRVTPFQVIARLAGLAIALVGATFLFAGLIGAAFKLVTDANRLALER